MMIMSNKQSSRPVERGVGIPAGRAQNCRALSSLVDRITWASVAAVWSPLFVFDRQVDDARRPVFADASGSLAMARKRALARGASPLALRSNRHTFG
ncbi:hypothetical protein ON010_g9543 [Phytophthora cinnamomi]|nr:hypothetical protein ON010_g9543 [Phytophthora cinnamomi]